MSLTYTQRQVMAHPDNRGLYLPRRVSIAVEEEIMGKRHLGCDSPVLYCYQSALLFFLDADGRPGYLEYSDFTTRPIIDGDREFLEEREPDLEPIYDYP